MNLSKIEKNFVSEVDKLLQKMDRELPKSASQIKEIKNSTRIATQRDQVNQVKK